MMALFPIRHPRLGLSIDARTITLAEVRRDWRRGWTSLALRRSSERELPPGLIRPSATEPNVSDVSALAAELRALRGSRRTAPGSVSAALSLPDLCARVGLLDFEHVPEKQAERDALVRWRFQKEFNTSLQDRRFAYRIFRVEEGQNGRANGADVIRARVLAVAIRGEIIDQYEQACEQAGLVPVNVGLGGLRLFDLYRHTLSPVDELFFLHLGESGFSFFALRHGCPAFLRVKPLRNGTFAATTSSSTSSSLSNEVLATLQFYTDLHPRPPQGSSGTSDPLRPLYIVGNHELPASAAESLGITISSLSADGLPYRKSRAVGRLSFAGLPALAGVIEM
ncbi:MAG: hypothetical protein O7C73_03480 [Nitrospirae bacterium]|nr:hypothetical protein [Nitrospirota bacterium]